jgi:hypothetical protein
MSGLHVTQDAASWQAGYNAGASGVDSSTCPPEVPYALAYVSGFLEGQAARRLARASAGK